MNSALKDDLNFMVIRQERDRYHQIACEYACALALATNHCDATCRECGHPDGPRWCSRVVEEVTGRKTGRAAVDEIKETYRAAIVGNERYPRCKKSA